MLISLVASRRRNYAIVSTGLETPSRNSSPCGSSRNSSRRRSPAIISTGFQPTSNQSSPDGSLRNSEDDLIDSGEYEYASESEESLLLEPVRRLPRRRSGLLPAWSARRFSNNVHSRILQKFPFLIEMFYWGLNYAAYRLSKVAAASFHGRKGNENVQLAQDHGISILTFEQQSIFSFLFPLKEVVVQQFFLKEHVGLMGVINQFYSLVHIPGTVA